MSSAVMGRHFKIMLRVLAVFTNYPRIEDTDFTALAKSTNVKYEGCALGIVFAAWCAKFQMGVKPDHCTFLRKKFGDIGEYAYFYACDILVRYAKEIREANKENSRLKLEKITKFYEAVCAQFLAEGWEYRGDFAIGDAIRQKVFFYVEYNDYGQVTRSNSKQIHIPTERNVGYCMESILWANAELKKPINPPQL